MRDTSDTSSSESLTDESSAGLEYEVASLSEVGQHCNLYSFSSGTETVNIFIQYFPEGKCLRTRVLSITWYTSVIRQIFAAELRISESPQGCRINSNEKIKEMYCGQI